MHIHPLRRQRQTHQDTLHPRPWRLEPECRAAIVHQVELHIPAPPYLLPFFFPLRVRHVFPSVDDGQITREESRQAVFDEGEKLLLVFFAGVEVVEEDPAYAARFLPVRDVEVFIAPGLEARVVVSVMGVAGRLDRAVEMDRVFVEEVARG